MEVFVYGALCGEGEEHDSVWRLLSLALSEVFGIESLPAVLRQEKGKPYFPERPDICFNLSHSHGAVVCAVHDKPIGVDIEKLRPAPKRLSSGLSAYAFFSRWTAMEATVKREGKTAAALLRGIEPDALCATFEDFLPGWFVAVCPSERAEMQLKVIG